MAHNPKIIFAGTPNFAAVALQSLIDQGYEIALVLSQPDARLGRGKKIQFSPVKQLAVDAGLPLIQPSHLKDPQVQAHIQAIQADWMIVVAYGLLIPQSILEMPKQACLNVHGSLLPKWRGAAPIQRAIEAGDHETGVCVMQMEAGLDTGPVLHQVRIPIEACDTSESLLHKLAYLGADALVKTIIHWGEPGFLPEVQDHASATYAHKLQKHEAFISWAHSAKTIRQQMMAFKPWPIAAAEYEGTQIKLIEAEVLSAEDYRMQSDPQLGEILGISSKGIDIYCHDSVLRLTKVQLPGKKPLSIADFLNGRGNFFQKGQSFQMPK